jgi:alkylated DNA repair dioxygenase AlkB
MRAGERKFDFSACSMFRFIRGVSSKPNVQGFTSRFFHYCANFLSPDEQARAVRIVDSNPFCNVIHRRQQHYGLTYYHTADDRPSIQPSTSYQHNKHSSIPLELNQFDWLLEKLTFAQLLPPSEPTSPADNPLGDIQILVNEYVDKQGISPHYDDPMAFGDMVVGISLLAPVIMTLTIPACLAHLVDRSIYDFVSPGLSESVSRYSDCACQAVTVANLNACANVLEMNTREISLEPGSLYALRGESRSRFRHGIRKSWSVRPKHFENQTRYRRLSLTIRRILPTRKQCVKTYCPPRASTRPRSPVSSSRE